MKIYVCKTDIFYALYLSAQLKHRKAGWHTIVGALFVLQVLAARLMPRRSRDSKNSRDNNWRRLWERQRKKSYLQRARLRRLSSGPSHPEDSVVPAHSSGSSDLIAMASKPVPLLASGYGDEAGRTCQTNG